MIDTTQLIEALRCTRAHCVCQKNGSGKHTLHCPAHDDEHPSLSLKTSDGKVLVHCNAGCTQEAVIEALRLRGLWNGKDLSVKTETAQRSLAPGVTLAALADAKKLPIEYLRSRGLSDCKYQGVCAVKMPYPDPEGNLTAVRFRVGLGKEGVRFKWRRGDHPLLYGLDRIAIFRRGGWVLLVEGESDCWTLWQYKIPALGIPGKSTWRAEWAEFLEGIEVYLWQEPDAADLGINIARAIPNLRVIAAPDGIKDPSEAHMQGQDVVALIERLKKEAVAADGILKQQAHQRISEFAQQATVVLQSPDPIVLVREAIQKIGYGGEIKPALITYLAATSRLVDVRPGAMLVHLILLGTPSAGKSWTIKVVTRLLPPEAYHVIDAGSPRALVYDKSDLRHRMVIFGEADSLPTGEDNPAASAIRNLLQDNQLKYKVVIRDPATGDFTVREVDKPGPTVLVTTAVRKLGEQLMTRLFSLEMADDRDQVLAALQTQATAEEDGITEPDVALVAFQAYLQARAPWDVHIPFAKSLAGEIGKSISAPRILRDFSRLLALIKATAILRHNHRKVDGKGRLIAEIDDYATIRDLVNDMYADSISGASKGIREVVDAVGRLNAEKKTDKITVTLVAETLGISKSSVSRRVKGARSGGWLVNAETRNGFPAILDLGEPLPPREGLPTPEMIADHCTVSRQTDEAVTPMCDREVIEL